MKLTLTVFWCALYFFCQAQTPALPDSLICIKFGSNKTAVVKLVTRRNGHWDTQHSVPQMYLFDNVNFDSKSKSVLAVKFNKDKAYEADYIITPVKCISALGCYFNMVKQLNKVYGAGKSTDKLKTLPKNNEIAGKVNDIKFGLASYSTYWRSNGQTIILSIDAGLDVILALQDDKLTQAAFERPDAG